MRPYIICHMASCIDGKIDGEALGAVMRHGKYEAIAKRLGGSGWICGRTTMQQHFAEPEPFFSTSNEPAGNQPVHVAREASSYAISVDTLGKLRWSSDNLDRDHLICIISEQVPSDYLKMLREKGISYIVSGASSIDLTGAMDSLRKYFGIHTLLLEGGGHINGAFVEAGLVDEVSLLLVPGIDGRHDIPTVFDGLSKSVTVALKLKSVEQLESDALWIRYEVIPAQEGEDSCKA